MSQIINELATIDVSDEAMQRLDLAGIYKSFSENYKKLDNLKNFRSEYEKQNALMRWWHNDALRNAQLDSTEVQGEFSKAIGQLMMISILQSKKLAQQQSQLKDQQQKLEMQAGGIAAQAGKLQEQHYTLAEQSLKLRTMVEDYIALKGMTEEGMEKLVAVAREIRATKESLAQHVDARTQALEAQCNGVVAQMQAMEEQLTEQTRVCMTSLRAHEADRQSIEATVANGLSQASAQLERQAAKHSVEVAALHECAAEMKAGLSASTEKVTACVQQQQAVQLALDGLQGKLSTHARRSRQLFAGLSVIAVGTLLGVVHALGWF